MPITRSILAPRGKLRAKSSKRKRSSNRCSTAPEFEPRLRSAFAFPALRFIFQTFRHEARSHFSLRRFDCCIDIVRAAERAVAFPFGSQFWPWRPSKAKRHGTSRGPRSSATHAAETKRPRSKKFGAHHFNRSVARLQGAVERRLTRARSRRRICDRWQSHHDQRARGEQQPLSHSRTRRRSEQVSGQSAVRRA